MSWERIFCHFSKPLREGAVVTFSCRYSVILGSHYFAVRIVMEVKYLCVPNCVGCKFKIIFRQYNMRTFARTFPSMYIG
jgi:hypothetical protein